jgi:hypothetical protein
MKIWILAFVFCLCGSQVWGGDAQLGGDVTGTAQIAGLTVPLDQILATPKTGYVYIVWDSLAERAAIKRAGKAFSLAAAALDLAKTVGVLAGPAAGLFKVDVAEFPERDDYGAPRWDKMGFLSRFVVTRPHGHWVVNKRPH